METSQCPFLPAPAEHREHPLPETHGGKSPLLSLLGSSVCLQC